MAIRPFSSVPQFVKEQSLTIADVATAATAIQSFTVTGLVPTMTIVLNPTADMPDNIGLGAAYVSAANTLKVQFINPTADTATGAAKTFKIIAL